LTENYCVIATSALLWFDFLSTLDVEYNRIWRRKFTGATLVYVGIRYVAVINRIFFVLQYFIWNSSNEDPLDPINLSRVRCGGILHTNDVLNLINDLALSAFTCLRIYGIWGRDWRPLVFVLPLALLKPISEIYEASGYSPSQNGPPFGCAPAYKISVSAMNLYYCSYGLLVYYASKSVPVATEAVVIVLTWIKTIGIIRVARKTGIRTPLAALLFRDGQTRYLILTCHPSQHPVWYVWQYFNQVFTNIAVSRLILNLRGIYFAESEGSEGETSLHLSDVRFRGLSTANIVGNLGATLMLSTHSAELASAPSGGRRSISHSRSHAESVLPERDGEGEMVDTHVAWDIEDEIPEYCDDPFTFGMREAVARDTIAQPTQPSSHFMAGLINCMDLEAAKGGHSACK
ncbi:hypothetical protein GY45DRAFT_1256064, partial [Cubamyces sp. BRFM 1775]